jgi:hypothetical protein
VHTFSSARNYHSPAASARSGVATVSGSLCTADEELTVFLELKATMRAGAEFA